jgi:hypothetical protein
MHYKDGTEAKLLDLVKFRRYSLVAQAYVVDVGVLVSASEGSSSCNGRVAHLKAGYWETEAICDTSCVSNPCYITIGECELITRPGVLSPDVPAAPAAPAAVPAPVATPL